MLARLAELAQSPAGAAACAALRPMPEPAEVAGSLEQTWQVFRLLQTDGVLPGTGVPDIREHLKTAAHEGFVLDGARLVEVRRVLTAGRELGDFLRQRRERTPALAALAARLHPLREIEDVLARALDEDGTVRDDASDELAGLRNRLRQLRAQLTRRLESMVNRGALSEVIAEQYVTLRNNRFVIPVKAHYGQKLQGIVQDRSASGETIFLEPLFAVEMNNAMLMTEREEERVIRRILADLTALVRSRGDEVDDVFGAITAFDVLAAKARFADHHRCTQPLPSEGDIDLRRARHPVLLFSGRDVVPVDIRLPAGKSTLVITGPNTGGKTVALKTLGLLSLMAQTGMLIPAEEESRLPCWRGVFADVGDEQNIQRNLSTFSAHVANLVQIDRMVEAPALVLLDEPGVGTDPEEGAALAIGLLQTMARRGARLVATTHYTPVKLYGLTEDTCVTASVDFDRATLAPRYRLIYHSLGESLALLIAEQLGLSAAVLERARAAQTAEAKTLNAALERLEASRRGYEERLAEVEGRERTVGERQREAAALLEELQTRRREKWRSELDAARDFVRSLKDEGRQLLAGLREQRAGRRELERFADDAAAAIATREAEETAPAPQPSGPLQPGDTVELVQGGFRGELVSVSGERAWMRRGTMRIEVPLTQLRRAGRAPTAATAAPSMRLPESEAPPLEVTLIGLRAREALERLEAYLDRAALAGHPSVRIIHGVGSGALRRAVQQYLETSPYCARFRDGEPGEGGAGVTVAELG